MQWHEGGWVDRADKAASRPILHMTLPVILEALVTVPASSHPVQPHRLRQVPSTFFGATTPSLGLIPVLIATQAELDALGDVPALYVWIGVVLCAAVLLIHTLVCLQKLDRELLWWGLPMLVVNLAVAHNLLAVGWHAQVFYQWCWGTTQLVCHLLKLLTMRQRPCAGLSAELGQVKRHFRIADHLSKGKPSIESFPSGDAAGSAVFGMTMLVITGKALWLLVALPTVFGRVYFHAHHGLDVIVGASVGMATTLLLGNAWSWKTFELHHFGVYLLIVAIAFKLIKLLQQQVPKHLQSTEPALSFRG